MLDVLSDEEITREYVLSKIIRYNNRCKLQNESVAEHTCFVSLFCLKILAKLKLDHETERKVLILAALHDAAESRTSDIPHDVKVNYPEMQCILDKVEEDYYNEVWEDYHDVVYKPGNLCYNILKLADSYSVYQYCLNEKALGNVSDVIEEITHNSMIRIKQYTNAINQMMKGNEI
jgi:5'-deoxynucleotidase YfbR-like HD superfamily hydrolase